MADMPKVKVTWTIEITENYSMEMDWDDFAAMFEGEPPTPEQVKAGEVDRYEFATEDLAGEEYSREEDGHAVTLDYLSVDERYVDSFEIIEN